MTAQWKLCFCLVFLAGILVAFSFAGKEKSVRKRLPTRSSVVVEEPASRTLVQWEHLPLESLRLVCQNLHLTSSGSRAVLARRLFDHHHPGNIDIVVSHSPFTVASSVSTSSPSVGHPTDILRTTEFQSMLRTELQMALSSLSFPGSSSNQHPVPVVPVPVSVIPPTAFVDSVAGNVNSLPIFHDGAAIAPTALTTPSSEYLSTVQQALLQSLAPAIPPQASAAGYPTLPPIPANILEQIKSSKFINFDNLLPSVSPLRSEEYALQINSAVAGEPTVSLVPHHQSRAKIIDLPTWLTAWTSFLQASILYHPHRMSQLIAYQATITRFASQYIFSAWHTYDRLFRYTMANDLSLSWGLVNDDLFNRYLRGASLRPVCFSCRNYGHLANNCPARSNSNIPTATQISAIPPVTAHLTTQLPPFRAPQRTSNPPSGPTCRFFNAGRQCSYHDCKYPHKCRTCYGDHPQSSCPSRLSRQ